MPPAQNLVYVLELDDGYLWVGASTNPVRAMRVHALGTVEPPCEWTTLHPPRRLRVCRPVAPGQVADEAVGETVLDLMARNGVSKVRGGAHAAVALPADTRSELRQRASARRALLVAELRE